jgi:hypothetical protein
MVLERRDAFNLAVEQLNVDAAPARADAADPGHGFLLAPVRVFDHCLKPLVRIFFSVS